MLSQIKIELFVNEHKLFNIADANGLRRVNKSITMN
jgi:hypothetical protein